MALLAVMNKLCIFRYEPAFVVGVKSYRWHHIQLDAVRTTIYCALLTALESFSGEKGRNVIRFLYTQYFHPIESYSQLKELCVNDVMRVL